MYFVVCCGFGCFLKSLRARQPANGSEKITCFFCCYLLILCTFFILNILVFVFLLLKSKIIFSIGETLKSSFFNDSGIVSKTNTSKISKQPVPPPGFIFRSQLYSNFFRSVFGTGKGSSSGIYYTTMNLLYQGINDEKTKKNKKTRSCCK
jgi:hypothetical protein